MRNLIIAGLGALSVLMTPACGLLLQTAVGWHTQEKITKTENKAVEVTSVPPGADVIRRGPDGNESPIGTAPLNDSIPYQVETTVEHPSVWGLVLGSVVEGAAAIAMIVAGSSSSSNSTSTGVDSPATDVGTDAGKALLVGFGATVLILLTLPELIVALVHGLSSESVVQKKTVGGSQQYLYAGRLAGYPDALSLVRVPDQGMAQLVLDPNAAAKIANNTGSKPSTTPPPVQKPAGTPTQTTQATQTAQTAQTQSTGTAPAIGATKMGTGWVIAVMDVEDLNAQFKDKAIDPGLVRNLGDQLRIFIAQRGVRTVDRGAQERAIKDQISSMKTESYKQCYDDSCQVELGKALAASHILRSRITRFGRRCVLNAELIDLKSEVTMAASSSQGDCQAEGFLTMSEAVASNLLPK